MSKYRIGIVGCGGIAHRHLAGYRAVASDWGEVAAGCDPNRETLDRFCDQYELPHQFSNAKEMVASGTVDVISLLTPPAVRSEVIFPAIEHGVHVLVEKPFAENWQDAASFVEAAEAAGTILAVNQQLRFMPDLLAVREILDAGKIGKVRFIAHDQYQNRTRTGGWRQYEERLEISIFSIHVLDRIRWLMGRRPETVMAVTRHWCDDVRGETCTALTIQFEEEGVGTMVSNWHALTIPECRLRLDGLEGSILIRKPQITSDRAHLTVQRLGEDPVEQECVEASAFSIAMGRSMQRVLQAVESGTPPVHSGRDNLETMAVVDAAYLSASRGGELVEIAEVADL